MKNSKKNKRDTEEKVDETEVEFYNDDTPNGFNVDPDDDLNELPVDIIKDLKKRLKESEREKIENLTGWQRSKADYINLKKRSLESQERIERHTRESVIQSFFPILDSFEVAMKGDAWEEASEKWKLGILSVYKQFLTSLSQNGIEEVGQVGEKFDPYIHTSVSMTPTRDEAKDHTVAEVLQKGYRFSTGEIIRSPKVVIYEKSP